MNAMRMPLVSASPSSFSDHLALVSWLERMTEAQAVRVILRQRTEKGMSLPARKRARVTKSRRSDRSASSLTSRSVTR